MDTPPSPLDAAPDPDALAAAKAETRTDVQIDFDLEDIIAGNAPETPLGRALTQLVEDLAGAPTLGRIEQALLPIYEASLRDFYQAEGGSGAPPPANRHRLRQHAEKIIAARKVKRIALMRASRKPAPASPARSHRPQLVVIAALLGLIVLVWLWRG